jgi:transposase
MDEFGFSFAELLATTWAPRGQRPILERIKKERRLVSTAVGLSLSGKIYKRHFKSSIKSPQVIRFLQHLLQFFPQGFILIWDRARIHTSALTRTFLTEHPEIQHEHFPAYAPELNPEEYCHGNVKHQLRNATPSQTDEITRLLDNGFARIRRRPDLIHSFFHAAGIRVN